MAQRVKNLLATWETRVQSLVGIFRGEGNGKIQYSYLENPTNRFAWWATCSSRGHQVSAMTERLTLSLFIPIHIQFSSVQLLSRVRLFATSWTAACQATLSITNSRNLPKLMSVELVMPSSYLILCCSLLLLPSIFLSIGVFSDESALHIRWPKYWVIYMN